MAASLPSLINVGSLLLLLYFIYGVVGTELFSDVEFGDFLNEHANFKTFYISLLTLFRCSTGESWNGVMHDLKAEVPISSIIFFVSFTMVASLVFINIFIAVILENFTNFG